MSLEFDPTFLTRELIDDLHHDSIEMHGGAHGLRNEHGLESAIAQPQHVYHYTDGDLFEIAAAYAFHLAESQAYIDGNKRVAILAAVIFPRTEWRRHRDPAGTTNLRRDDRHRQSRTRPKWVRCVPPRAIAEEGMSRLRTRDRKLVFLNDPILQARRASMSMNIVSFTRRQCLLNTSTAAFLAAQSPKPQRRVIIDTDPGVDDALAIFLAVRSPELKIEALTPVAGNVPLELTLPNALRLLEIAGRTDIPVATGASQPLKRRLITATYAHGENGLAGVPFPAPKTKPVSESATQLIRRMVRKSPGEIHLVALGPLTNIAQAFLEDPELPRMIPSLTLMGGSLSGGNITPAAEFNIYADPDAAQVVFRTAGLAITMVGLDVTRKATIAEPEVRFLEASKDDPVSRAAGQITRAALNRKLRQPPGSVTIDLAMHDSLAIAAFLDPSVVTLQDYFIEVETAGEYTAGETLGYSKSPMRKSAPFTAQAATGTASEPPPFRPNAKVAVGLDRDRFVKLLLDRLASQD